MRKALPGDGAATTAVWPEGTSGWPEGTWGWPAPPPSPGGPTLRPPHLSGFGTPQIQESRRGGGDSHQGPPATVVSPNTGNHRPLPQKPAQLEHPQGSPSTRSPQPFPQGSWGAPPGTPLPFCKPCWPFHQYFLTSWV